VHEICELDRYRPFDHIPVKRDSHIVGLFSVVNLRNNLIAPGNTVSHHMKQIDDNVSAANFRSSRSRTRTNASGSTGPVNSPSAWKRIATLSQSRRFATAAPRWLAQRDVVERERIGAFGSNNGSTANPRLSGAIGNGHGPSFQAVSSPIWQSADIWIGRLQPKVA
jgi:hypothetical protein